jgi:hypothetical protein
MSNIADVSKVFPAVIFGVEVSRVSQCTYISIKNAHRGRFDTSLSTAPVGPMGLQALQSHLGSVTPKPNTHEH